MFTSKTKLQIKSPRRIFRLITFSVLLRFGRSQNEGIKTQFSPLKPNPFKIKINNIDKTQNKLASWWAVALIIMREKRNCPFLQSNGQRQLGNQLL